MNVKLRKPINLENKPPPPSVPGKSTSLPPSPPQSRYGNAESPSESPFNTPPPIPRSAKPRTFSSRIINIADEEGELSDDGN